MTRLPTTPERSANMSRIRGRGNKETEVALVKLLRAKRITGWRRHQPLFGKPDFIFPRLKFAVFVDGCFWHRCPKHGTEPKNNRSFWEQKLSRNQARDVKVNRTLRKMGWTILRIWEHELNRKGSHSVLRKIQQKISSISDSTTDRRAIRNPSRK
jgi:DNA mismatch endonuclease, patch repair protein